MKFKTLLVIFGFFILMLLSTLSLEAASGESGNTSSEIIIGQNPDDFTITGHPMLGRALMDMVQTDLVSFRCPNDNSRPYSVVVSEDPRMVEVIEKEIELSSSPYADPATRLTPNALVANHLAKGNATFKQGSVSIDLKIEDRQGNVKAQTKLSGPENNFFKLVDKATRLLANQMCTPEPKETCPYLWEVIFKQTGTHNSNRCFAEGLEDWQTSEVDAYARFNNVLIYTPDPNNEPNMSSKMWKACKLKHKDFMETDQTSVGKAYYRMYGGDEVKFMDRVYLSARGMHQVTGEPIIDCQYDDQGGVSLKEFKDHMATFKRPASRQSFSLTGKCGVVYYFIPIPFSNK